MAEDIERTQDGGARFDQTGDIATVSGDDNVLQQIQLDIYAETDLVIGGQLDKGDLRRLESDIRTVLSNNDYVDDVVALQFTRADDNTLTVTIRTISEELNVPLE